MDTKTTTPDTARTAGYPAGTAHTDAGQSPSRLQDRVDDAAQSMHQAVDRLAERAKPPLQRMEEGLDHGSQVLHRGADQVREMADEWTVHVRGTVREHPLAAVGTALLFGLLLGRVTR
jgi:ElaB/YqjD/DUF883 family membrane-anchored ribosome-binding protein